MTVAVSNEDPAATPRTEPGALRVTRADFGGMEGATHPSGQVAVRTNGRVLNAYVEVGALTPATIAATNQALAAARDVLGVSAVAKLVGRDPLIAEAKARARRRRLLALGMLVVVAAAIGTTFALRSPNGGARESGAPPGTGQLGPRVAIYGFDVSKWKSHGLISAVGRSRLWLSANAGRTWHPVRVPGLGGPYPLSRIGGDDFVDLLHGWVVLYSSNGVRIDRTTDGGRTWRASDFPGGSWGAGLGFRTRLDGYLDITVNGRDERFVTRNGGAIWTLKQSQSRLLRRQHAVKLVYSAKPGVPSGTLMQTNDHGRHWTAVSLPGNPALQSVNSFGRVVVVPAHSGRCGDLGFYISDDGGLTWKLRCASRRINPGIPQIQRLGSRPRGLVRAFRGTRGSVNPVGDA